MAEIKNKALARHLSQVKKLDPSVSLESYYQDIKPFLFGTNSTIPISAENLPNGGIYSVAKSGVFSPSDDKVIAKVSGRTTAEFKIANVRNQEFISDVQTKKRPASEYLFPSDVVRILTGIAKLFRNGNSTTSGLKFTYNQDSLQKYISEPDDLRWVREWGEVNVDPKLLRIEPGLFYEKQFETKHSDKVAELLSEVIQAAIEFENIFKPINTDQFIPKSELETEFAIPYLQSQILSSFKNYQEKIVPKIDSEQKFAKASEQIKDQILELLKRYSTDFFRSLWTSETEKKFAQKEIANLEQNTYLWTTRSSDNLDGVLQTEEFTEFTQITVSTFLQNYSDSLSKDYISPLFEEEKKDLAVATDSEEDTDEDSAESEDQEKVQEEIENKISYSEFKTRLTSDLIRMVYERFVSEYIESELRTENEEEYQRFIDNQYVFENNYIDTVYENIRASVVQNWINSFQFTDEFKQSLTEQNLYLDNQVSSTIFESEWYQNLLETYLDTLPDIDPPQGDADSYFEYLYLSLVIPALQALTESPPEDSEAEETPTDFETEPRPAAGATVPTEIPAIDTVQTDSFTTQTSDISRLTPEQIRSLQYESAWMYNRAVYELFTAHGISEDQVRNLSPQLLQELQAGIFNYTAGLDQESLTKLFASSTQRQKSLLEFYKTFYQKNNGLLNSFYKDLPSAAVWNTLSPDQKQALTTRTRDVFVSNQILTPEQILSSALTEATNLENTVLYQNIKNTVDTWVQQYGLNEPYFAFDPDTQTVTQFEGENSHDVVWFISNLSAERLELILGLPEGLLANNSEFESKFKEILLQYAKYSFSEQTLHIKNTTLQNGLIIVSEEDAKAIENGDEQVIQKHLAFTNGLRETNKEHGSETVAGALDHKKDSSRKEILKSQYKTFLPLWNQLSGVEQAEIYKKYNLVVPQGVDLEIEQLEFRPELVGFDITDLEKIRKIVENKKLSKQEKEKLLELIAIQDQLQKEEALSEFFIESQEFYSEPEEIEVILQLTESEDPSYAERFRAEQAAYSEAGEDYGYKIPSGGNPGLRKRISNSRIARRLKKRFKKKLDPLKKAKKGFKNAAGNLATKTAAASLNAIPVVGTGLSAALMAIPNKKLRNAISTVILGGVTALIGSTIYALGSIGGIIGAVIGAGVGFIVSGGAVAVPSAIVGAHIGNAILPTRWTGLIFGGSQAAAPASPTTTTAAATAATAASTDSLTLASLSATSIGVAAPFIAILGIIFITLYIIFMIQSAFLIPVPQDRSGGGVGELTENGFECFVFAGPNQLVNTGMEEQVEDISISWTQAEKEMVYEAYARRAGKNSCFNSYVCGSGTIEIYRLSGSQYGGWAPSSEGGRVIFLYDLAFTGSIDSLEYTLIHELGHVIDYKKVGDFLNKFMQIWDRPNNGCLTYPFPELCSAAEAFAESITLYVNHETYLYKTPDGGRALFDFPNEAPAEYQFVEENIFCDEPIEQSQESYLAIGPLSQSNIVMSSVEEIQNPQLTCSWSQGKNLDVAINANYFNTKENGSLVPVGLAGYCPTGNNCSQAVNYYEDATSPSINQYLKSFGFDTSGNLSILNGIPDMQAAAPNLSSAVTGSYSNTQSAPDIANKRTTLGIGVANSECSEEYAGQQTVFMAVLPFAKFAEAEALLFGCGATQIIHLDGGGSSNFCSSEATFSQNRYIPVNMGMKNAEIITNLGSEVPESE